MKNGEWQKLTLVAIQYPDVKMTALGKSLLTNYPMLSE
jgi:hypothetical protein